MVINDGLDLLINSFNTQDRGNIEDILRGLNSILGYKKDISILNTIETKNLRKQAEDLINLAKDNKIIVNWDTFDKQFNKLGNLNFNNINQTYNLVDDLIYKVDGTIDWINKYVDFIKILTKARDPELQHKALVKLAQTILAEANQLCPIDTGRLRKSGVVLDFWDKIIVAYTIDYATYVHEDLNARHNVGQAKFLEIAAQRVLGPRAVWTEQLGFGGVMIELSINKNNISPYNIKYSHYGST